jgi:hypothetical protein
MIVHYGINSKNKTLRKKHEKARQKMPTVQGKKPKVYSLL